MRYYIIKRLLLSIPTLLGITVLTFLITRFVPGGPLEQILSELKFSETEQRISHEGLVEEDLAYLKELYGLDKNWFVAYWDWLKKIVFFNFGDSYRYNEPVHSLIFERLPVAIYYGLVTTILPYLICIPLGVFKALKSRSFFDNSTSVAVFIGYTIPPFVLGLLLILFFASYLIGFPYKDLRVMNL